MLQTILITAHPELSDVYHKAMSYCQSSLDAGNEIKQIFFIHDAIFMAVHSQAKYWAEFAKRYNIELQSCPTTAEQKSIYVQDFELGFLQGGLSSLVDSILGSDSVLQINADFELCDIEFVEPVLNKKKCVFVFESLPKEHSLSAEGIDLLLVFSAFETDVRVVFKNKGIKNIQHDEGHPRYVRRFKALPDFDVEECYMLSSVSENSLINSSDSFTLDCKVITESECSQLTRQTHTLCF